MGNFLKFNKLEDIERIERVVLDVVEDRSAMVEDGVLTFEKYSKVFENNFDNHVRKNLKPSESINYEKILADRFKISLGFIEKMDDRVYQVKDKKYLILSDEDVQDIRNSVINEEYNSISDKVIEINHSDPNVDQTTIGDLVIQKEILNNILDTAITFNSVLNNMKDILNINLDTISLFEYKNHFIYPINES